MKVDFRSTAGAAAVICGGLLRSGDPLRPISSLTTDSRCSDPESLFVALKGERFDGHDFIEELISADKAAACIVSEGALTPESADSGVRAPSDTAVISCSDTLRALADIAYYHRRGVSPLVAGVTGTSGKTTVKELTAAVLGTRFNCYKNEKNYNNEVGVPFTLLGLRPDHEAAVIEMGMNHAGEINRLTRAVLPDMTIVTSIGEGHIEGLGSVENVARAKAEIFNGALRGGTAVINRDTKCFDIIERAALAAGQVVLTYGLSSVADVYPESYEFESGGFNMKVRGVEVSVPLFGIHNLYNALAAVAAGIAAGIDPEQASDVLSGALNVPGRTEVIDRGFLIVNDAYNSNPLSARAAIQSAAEIYPHKRRIAVLGDMRELGGSAVSFHREIGGFVVESGFDLMFLWGDHAADYRDGALNAGADRDSVIIFESKDELTDKLIETLNDDDLVLVKGSRSTRMDEVVEKLTGEN